MQKAAEDAVEAATLAELAKDADEDDSGQFEFAKENDGDSPEKVQEEPSSLVDTNAPTENESVFKFQLRCRLQRGSIILDKLSEDASLILFFQQVAVSYELRSDR